MKKLLMVFLAVALVFTTVTFGCAKKNVPEKAKKDISNVKKDVKKAAPKTATPKAQAMVFVKSTEKPEACASCHPSSSKEYSLSKEIVKIKKHPKVTVSTVADCLKCHHASGYPPFKKVIHKPHYKTGSIFVKAYKGSCVHCHKLTASGLIQVPGVDPKATYETIEVAQVDKAPKGCASCHKKVDGKDFTLPQMTKKISGHPSISFNDFNLCYACHNGKKAPQLGLVMHKRHLINNDIYKKNYGNSCINCHKLKNGEVFLKGKKSS